MNMDISVLLLILSALSTEALVTIGNRYNWALKGNASQSSTTSPAERAIDGDITNVLAYRSCSQTTHSHNPWWMVDLKTTVVVDEVYIVNRGDCCGDQLKHLDIRVRTGDYVYEVCHLNNRRMSNGKAVVFPCMRPLAGDAVRIQLMGLQVTLALCEVKVFGRKYQQHEMSWGSGMPTRLSSTRNEREWGSYRAVDGYAGADKKYMSCARAADNDTRPWLLVNLKQKIRITRIRIWNSIDCCDRGLENIYSEVLHLVNDSDPRICQHLKSQTIEQYIDMDCKPNLVGTWVRVWKDKKHSTNKDFTLCEVEIFGTKIVTNPDYLKRQDNYALQKPTSSSGGKNHSLAVDGEINNAEKSATCMLTLRHGSVVWWKVNVGFMYVEAVVMVLQTGCCKETNVFTWVIYVDDKILCGRISSLQVPGSVVSVTCPGYAPGTYVVVKHRPVVSDMTLCEVEVYGSPEVRNWALGRLAFIQVDDGAEERSIPALPLVDGDVSNGYGTGACPIFMSANAYALSILVDLEDAHIFVDKILYVTPVGNDAPTTITNAHIKLHDSEKGSTSDRACVPPQKVFRPGLLITVNCTGPKETRLANKIILENGVGEISLGICEVEVYGELAFFK